jgi:AcrR family transcriptional regulator
VGTSKGAETKASILESAIELSSRLGLEGLSIGELARKTGLSKSGLFAHFQSKQNLQIEVLQASVESFIQSVVAPALKKPRGTPRVRALFDNWLDWERNHEGGCFFVAAANELDDRPGPLRERLVSYQRDWLDALSTAARIAVEEGHFREGLDTKQFAYDFYSILLAYQHFSRLVGDPEAEARARRSFERLLEASSA